ncbi:protein RRP5 homolog [Tribolium madens]|uniref:protein RRP5 homolog n=1 Tax=Tribolium madens TaxID=41895 RepID=UPI001CF743F1|nr:protein RRP5 homolog [Tribolium madens]
MEGENFPRGGKKIRNNSEQTKRKHEESLFQIAKQPKVKRARKEVVPKKDVNTEGLWQASIKFQGTLTYDRVQDGMVVLSCIRHFSNLSVQVEFPGLTYGSVPINQISDIFTTSLTDELKTNNDLSCTNAVKDIISVGQLVPTKILSVSKTEKGHNIQASINPRDVNAGRTHTSFKKGALIWANIVTELDHGYELTLGVNNCRVFLPFKNTEDSQSYVSGEPLYCVIHKVITSDNATTLTVSAKHEHLHKSQVKDDLSINDLIPGMKVDFFVEEVLPHGIKGQFFENCYGYVDETYIFSLIKKEKIKEGKSIPAYVLFVEPVTKVTYLTLRGLEKLPGPEFTIGEILPAQIQYNVPKGLYLQLDKNVTGFVSNKRLLNTLPKGADLDIVSAVRKKYPNGSRHNCRILDYNSMQQLYICTFEKQVIKEKIFTINDIKIGQVVTALVTKIIGNGLIVKVGHVQGFVPNLQLSNVKYTDNIKAKFSVGMTVNARVLNITNGNVILTLKQGLVELEKCLATVEELTPFSQYVGFVIQTKISGALVAFYGDIKGWISNKVLNTGSAGHYLDPREYFFIGQVVTVWILGIKNDKLQLSLNAPKKQNENKIKIGQTENGLVTKIHSDSLDVKLSCRKIEATIPLAHLSTNLSLCPILLKTYQVGQEIENILCIKNSTITPVMSRREFIELSKHSNKIPKYRDLKKGMFLRCSFEGDAHEGIYVSTPIRDYYEKIFVGNDNIIHKEGTLLQFEKQQCIIGKILNVQSGIKKIELCIDYENLQNPSLNDSLHALTATLDDLNYVLQLRCQQKEKLAEYKIGQRVECVVKKVNNDGNQIVVLPNGIEGLVFTHLSASNKTIGSVVEGVVLDYNFDDNYLYICSNNTLKEKINNVQDGVIKKSFGSSSVAKILLITNFYVLALLKNSQFNRQLVYLTHFKNAVCGEQIKVVVDRKAGNKLIGLLKKLALSLKKDVTKEQAKKRQNLKKGAKKSVNEEECLTQEELTDDAVEEIMIEQNEESEENISECEDDDSSKNTHQEIMIEQNEESEENMSECEDDDSSKSTNQKIMIKQNEEFEENISESEDDSYNNSNTKSNGTTADQSSNAERQKESVLSGAQTFYLPEDNNLKDESSEEEEEDVDQTKKKVKLTPAERAEIAKKEEERISKIENELADSTIPPQSAEQFDRLLLANPNSSKLWLQYMSMHIASTELDKARAIGKRALETINMTLVKEKYNVWIALLNLENMYGTKESFDKTFEEAVRYNDSLEIYLNVIQMLATSGKLLEMEEKIKKVRPKEKQNTKMWLEISRIYYSLGKFKEARNVKESALKSILDKKRQFDLIVKFGIMEFQLGELDQAIANFETILDTYPSKVNIWIIYVDQLVRKKKFDAARKTLERAISQKFALKTMKVLFQKFVSFEEQYGSRESVEDIKSKAKEYLSSLGVK